MKRRSRPGRAAAGTVASALIAGSLLSACGGSSKHGTTRSASAAHASVAPAANASPATATTPVIATGPVRATLHGAGHTPAAGKLWAYSVHASDASGKPLAGTVETEFVVPGIGVVGKETPAVHPLRHGVLNDHVTFPPAAVGHPIYLVTVVHTSAGSVALGWSVNVKG